MMLQILGSSGSTLVFVLSTQSNISYCHSQKSAGNGTAYVITKIAPVTEMATDFNRKVDCC